MKTYVLIYNTFANFEVVLPMYLLNTAADVVTISVAQDNVKSKEGLTIVPDMLVKDVVLTDEDVLLIPGGDPSILDGNEEVYALIRQGKSVDAVLAAICAGPIHLAKAGVLEGREYTTSLPHGDDSVFDPDLFVKQNVVVDEFIVTAQPTGYAELGIVLGQIMDIYENKADLEETARFFMEYEIQ